MGSIERKVWIFKTADVKPTQEDGFDLPHWKHRVVLALHLDGEWESISYEMVAEFPETWPEWMQYPDLKKHEERFNEAY